jgi:mono/diheme cytochrome c family protein
LVLASAGAIAHARGKSVWSGVYTEAQATAGEKVYYDRCVTCHGDDLGGVEKAPALAGSAFLDSWDGKSLRKLLERIESMPPDEPKVVSTAEAVQALAFLLRSSEIPAGPEALPADRTALATITVERVKP